MDLVESLRDKLQSIKDKPWHPLDIAFVNNHKVRLGFCKGSYGWHKHESADEFFIVLEGKLIIEFKGKGNLVLRKGDYAVVHKGTVHNLVSTENTYVLVFEPIHLQTTRVN
jgi:mannose-6-phosphate isomerase-like protein (cupin superfamily)